MDKITLDEASKLNNEKRDELMKRLNDSGETLEEIQKEIDKLWSDIAKNIDYNF